MPPALPRTGNHTLGNHLAYERFTWFDRLARLGRYPNATTLARRFELSPKTAQRNIEFFRFRLGADALTYDPVRKGYAYPDDSFALPAQQVSQEELLAVLVARSLLRPDEEGPLAAAIRSLGDKLRACLGGSELSETLLDEALSAVAPGHAGCAPDTFAAVLHALLGCRLLTLAYRAPSTGAVSERSVEPHHLQHYAGSWVLTAFCRERGAWRVFYLSRIEAVADTGQVFTRRPRAEWGHRVAGAYGVFQGAEPIPITLRFTPYRARWVREQRWPPEQVLAERPDGGVDLSFPVADLREVQMQVLSFGAGVEVREPAELRELVAEEVGKMAALYRTGEDDGMQVAGSGVGGCPAASRRLARKEVL